MRINIDLRKAIICELLPKPDTKYKMREFYFIKICLVLTIRVVWKQVLMNPPQKCKKFSPLLTVRTSAGLIRWKTCKKDLVNRYRHNRYLKYRPGPSFSSPDYQICIGSLLIKALFNFCRPKMAGTVGKATKFYTYARWEKIPSQIPDNNKAICRKQNFVKLTFLGYIAFWLRKL